MTFDYDVAFKRNLGWITPLEQEAFKQKKIAVGGLGGVGGDHILTLVRMGFSCFHIADLDVYDYSNFNRQAGATVKTVGRPKIDVIKELVMEINPEAQVTCFSEGIQDHNLDAFLADVDVYVDSLDMFALDIRRKVFAACYDKKIPALTAAPLGMGASFLAFMPGKGMSFDRYFGMQDASPKELESVKNDSVENAMCSLSYYVDNIVRFITGVAPSVLQRKYLVDVERVDLFSRDLPSTKMGIDLATGMLCTNLVKVLTGRGKVVYAPRGLHFDAFRDKFLITWRPGGYKNPLTIIMKQKIERVLGIKKRLARIRTRLSERKEQLHGKVSDAEMAKILRDEAV